MTLLTKIQNFFVNLGRDVEAELSVAAKLFEVEKTKMAADFKVETATLVAEFEAQKTKLAALYEAEKAAAAAEIARLKADLVTAAQTAQLLFEAEQKIKQFTVFDHDGDGKPGGSKRK